MPWRISVLTRSRADPADPARNWGANPASAVYGTIVAAGLLVAETASTHSVGAVAASLVVTLVVFWLAHAYTDTLGSAITGTGTHAPDLPEALRAELPIVESGALPVLALLLAGVFGADESGAAWAALVVCVVDLFGWGVLAARRAGRSGPRLVGYSAAVTALGVVLIALKFLIH